MPKANFRIKTREEFIRDNQLNRVGRVKDAYIPIGKDNKFFGRKIYLTEWERSRGEYSTFYRDGGNYENITFQKKHLVPIDTPIQGKQVGYEQYQ